MIAISENFEEPIVASRSIMGIPFSWFHQIDIACDAFFARRGIKRAPTFIERMHLDLEIGLRRKAHRDSKNSVHSVQK